MDLEIVGNLLMVQKIVKIWRLGFLGWSTPSGIKNIERTMPLINHLTLTMINGLFKGIKKSSVSPVEDFITQCIHQQVTSIPGAALMMAHLVEVVMKICPC